MELTSGFLSEILFRGKMYCYANLFCFQTKFQEEGSKSLWRGQPPVEESQASDSIMWLLNSVNNIFSFKIRISHHIYKSF